MSGIGSSRSSDSFFPLEDTSSQEDELDADIVQWLRPYGVRFIRDLRTYRQCTCSVPSTITIQFRDATDSIAMHFKDTNGSTPFCFQLVPNREDFVQDPYGDFSLQDFFVERDSRGSAAGVLHFSGMFANLEYDRTLPAYRILNLGGDPKLSLIHRAGKDTFKQELVEFVRKHSSKINDLYRCPVVNSAAHLFVLSYPVSGKLHEASNSLEKEEIKEPNAFINYVVTRRKFKQHIEFPSYLLYTPNWLTHTIEEQFENYCSNIGLRSVVTSVELLKKMTDNEIAAEDASGEPQAPDVMSYQALVRTHLVVESEPVGRGFQRLTFGRTSGQRQISAMPRYDNFDH